MLTSRLTPTRVIAAGLVALLMSSYALVASAQDTDPRREANRPGFRSADSTISMQPRPFKRQRGASQSVLPELPEGAQTLTMKDGGELFFHDGTLYRAAEGREGFVALPARPALRKGAARINGNGDRRLNRAQRARMWDRQLHRQHWRRFHMPRRRG